MNDIFSNYSPYFLVAVMIWDVIWKGLALWRAAKNNSKVWFVLLLILNTAGILPIIYLIYDWHKRKKASKNATKPTPNEVPSSN